jgi:hypothetical protein
MFVLPKQGAVMYLDVEFVDHKLALDLNSFLVIKIIIPRHFNISPFVFFFLFFSCIIAFVHRTIKSS